MKLWDWLKRYSNQLFYVNLILFGLGICYQAYGIWAQGLGPTAPLSFLLHYHYIALYGNSLISLSAFSFFVAVIQPPTLFQWRRVGCVLISAHYAIAFLSFYVLSTS